MATLILRVLRWGVGLLFIFAGAAKARDTQQFALAVKHYELTSWTFSIVIAVVLPWLEITAGAALLTRRLRRGALATLLALAIIFLGAIGSAWWRGLDVTCGCFGREINRTNFPLHFVGDALLLAALGLLAFSEARDDFDKRSGVRELSNVNSVRISLLLLLIGVCTASSGCRQSLAQPASAPSLATPPPSPVAAEAERILAEMKANEVSARANSDLKLRALRNPLTRAKAMQFFAIEISVEAADTSAPNLNQLFHTKPGDNCPICRAREKMQAPANDL